MERKYLTKQFVHDNTNNFYYDRSRKKALNLLYTGICLGILAFAYIAYAYKHRILDDKGIIVGIFGTLLVLAILVLIPMLVLMYANHLYSKKREAFMQEFRDYNNKVTDLVQSAIKNTEEAILTNPESAKNLHQEIRKIEDDYEWIKDISFGGVEEKGISLTWAYTNTLTHLAEQLKDLGIQNVGLDDISIANLVKSGVRMSDETVFAKVGKILATRSEATKYRDQLTNHLDERKILQSEINDYFAALTRSGLTFTETSPAS